MIRTVSRILRPLVLAALPIAAALSAGAEDRGAAAPEFVWHDVPTLKWQMHGNARLKDGILTCEADAFNRNAFATADIDCSPYDGRPLQMHVSVSTDGVTASEKGYLGFRFLLSYLDIDKDGGRVWPMGPRLLGTQPMQEVVFRDIHPKRRGKASIQLGLLDCTGRAIYNLNTLQVRATPPVIQKVNTGYRVRYSESVRDAPLLRGVMLGDMDGEEPWKTLRSWGATLVRHQIGLGGTGPATNHAAYVKGYLKNFRSRLSGLERNLSQARKYGMKVCIDQHSYPGGRCDDGDPVEWRGDCRMFHDPVYAQLFIDCWVELVRRVTPWRDTIYGYDLINEACHSAPALPDGDIFNLQRRCAEAIRAVDPDTPIVVEPMYCDPGWFAQFSALKMDNVIYQVHLYYPHDYTHQGVLKRPDRVESWPDPKKGWNREYLLRSLRPAIDFQREHGAKMYAGEFSAIAWAPNAELYIRDCISVFEELGWDWTYHAFREFNGWSVEHEAISRGMSPDNFRKSPDNSRMRVLKQGIRGGFSPDGQGRTLQDHGCEGTEHEK